MYIFFLQSSASGTLYIDDNESFEYTQKKYLYLQFTFKDGVLSSRYASWYSH